MKKTKKIVALLLLVVLVAFVLVACDPKNDHVHDFSTDWKMDAREHWHACFCEERSDAGEHDFRVYKDENGVFHYTCTVCGFERPNADEVTGE